MSISNENVFQSVSSDSRINTNLKVLTNRLIIMDWPNNENLFSIYGYKSLESLFSVYPNAIYRIYITAPFEPAYNHKISNLLPIMTFIKYKKLSYNIEVVPVGKMNTGYLSQIGRNYWLKYMKQCCDDICNNSTCYDTNHLQPYHVLHYIRLHKLWRYGGIFNDFSFLFLNQINHSIVLNGFYINSQCNKDYQYLRGSYLNNSNATQCYTSTLFIFEPKSDIVLCALKSYEEISFIKCIETDLLYGGAHCIQAILNDCFKTSGLINDLIINENNILEVFKGNINNARNYLLNNQNNKLTDLSINKKIVWLGDLSYNPMVSKQTTQTTVLTNNKTFIEKIIESNKLKQLKNVCTFNCNKSNSSFIKSCQPTIIIVGFEAQLTDNLYNILSNHPQILPTKYGINANTKQFGCLYEYSNMNSTNLDNCYPKVNKNEKYGFIESNMQYSFDKNIPNLMNQLQQTNEENHMKIVFVIEHPIERMYEMYRKYYQLNNINITFNNIILNVIQNPFNSFSILRQLITNKTNSNEIINYYYNIINNKNENINQTESIFSFTNELFLHSIAFPVILYYQKTLNNNNIFIINNDDFNLNIINETNYHKNLLQLFTKLQICKYKYINPTNNIQNQPNIPKNSHKNLKKSINQLISYELLIKLNKYFYPFIENLMNLTNYNLTSWHDTNRVLSLTNHNNNDSLNSMSLLNENKSYPLLWFENDIKDSSHARQGIISHLLHSGYVLFLFLSTLITNVLII